MSVIGSLDAIAAKADNMSGLKRVYAVGIATDVRPIPRGIDDGPVGAVYLNTFERGSGNAEVGIYDVTLDIWCQAEDAGWANQTLMGFVDAAPPIFRQDMDLGGECTRCELVGGGPLEPEEQNGRYYLVLPLRLQVLITRFAADATA